jgi:hypothetical protein
MTDPVHTRLAIKELAAVSTSSNHYSFYQHFTYSTALVRSVRQHCILEPISLAYHRPYGHAITHPSGYCHIMIPPRDLAFIHTPQKYGHERSTYEKWLETEWKT